MGRSMQKTGEIELPKSKVLLKEKNLWGEPKKPGWCMNASKLFGF